MKSKNLGSPAGNAPAATRRFPRRGEVWWVALDPVLGSEIAKTRPCVIVSRDTLNELRRTVVVILLSSSPTPHPPIHVAVLSTAKPSVAVVDQIRAISKQRLVRRESLLTEPELASIEDALQQILDLT